MANLKITEVQTADSLDGAHLLVTRPEPDGEGGTVESLRRVSAEGIADRAYVDGAIADLRDELTYKPPQIESLTVTPSVTERRLGTQQTVEVTVAWRLNKVPATMEINGESETASQSGSVRAEVTQDTTFTLTVTDNKGEQASKSASIRYVWPVYCGGISGETTQDKVLALTKAVRSGVAGSYSVTLHDGDVICFATADAGVRSFRIGVLDYELARETLVVTNGGGASVTYYVYRTASPLSAGTVTLEVR